MQKIALSGKVNVQKIALFKKEYILKKLQTIKVSSKWLLPGKELPSFKNLFANKMIIEKQIVIICFLFW